MFGPQKGCTLFAKEVQASATIALVCSEVRHDPEVAPARASTSSAALSQHRWEIKEGCLNHNAGFYGYGSFFLWYLFFPFCLAWQVGRTALEAHDSK
jgi:hypothetical protein